MEELKPSLIAQISKINPKEYSLDWIDESITGKLNINSAYRRQAAVMVLEDWVRNLKNDWWLTHSVKVNEAAVIENLSINKPSYSNHLMEISMVSILADSDMPFIVFSGEERRIEEEKCFKILESFCNKHVRALSDTFLPQVTKLLKKSIHAFGPHFQLTIADENDSSDVSNLKFIIKSTQLEFAMSFVFVVP